MYHLAREKFHWRANHEVMMARFIVAMGYAVTATVVALYLRQVGLSDSQVGIANGLMSVAVILLAPLAPILHEKFNELAIYIIGTLLLGMLNIGLGSSSAAWLALSLLAASHLAIFVIANAGSIAFRDVSGSKKEYVKSQGLASSLINVGWIMGPLLAGLTLAAYGAQKVFYLGAAIMLLAVVLLILAPVRTKRKQRQTIDSNWRANLRFYASRPNLLRAYVFRSGVSIWWSFMWTFIPLFLIDAGYSVGAIGAILAVTQVPLFLLEFKTVELIRPLGYQTIFTGSFGLMALVMAAAFISSDTTLIIVGLVGASLALAFLEPISEIFFYDQVHRLEEERAYPVYFTADSVGSMIAKLGIGVGIGLLGGRASYALMALIMGLIVWQSRKIQLRHNH